MKQITSLGMLIKQMSSLEALVKQTVSLEALVKQLASLEAIVKQMASLEAIVKQMSSLEAARNCANGGDDQGTLTENDNETSYFSGGYGQTNGVSGWPTLWILFHGVSKWQNIRDCIRKAF